MDEFVDGLLQDEEALGIALPAKPSRMQLERNSLLAPRESPLVGMGVISAAEIARLAISSAGPDEIRAALLQGDAHTAGRAEDDPSGGGKDMVGSRAEGARARAGVGAGAGTGAGGGRGSGVGRGFGDEVSLPSLPLAGAGTLHAGAGAGARAGVSRWGPRLVGGSESESESNIGTLEGMGVSPAMGPMGPPPSSSASSASASADATGIPTGGDGSEGGEDRPTKRARMDETTGAVPGYNASLAYSGTAIDGDMEGTFRDEKPSKFKTKKSKKKKKSPSIPLTIPGIKLKGRLGGGSGGGTGTGAGDATDPEGAQGPRGEAREIEEQNALRAKLGIKLLRVENAAASGDRAGT